MQIMKAFRPRTVGLFFGSLSLYFALQSLFSEFMSEWLLWGESQSHIINLLDLFSVNVEESVPTWYSTLLLFIAAVLLALITTAAWRRADRYRFHWLGLTLVFLYLSMDEGAAIHEIASDPMQEIFNTSGFFAFGWQIAALPFVILFGLVYIRFWWQLPARTRFLFAAAAVIYVGGAIVVEGFSARRYDLDGGVSFPYLSIATVEEFFEMLGATLFIYALVQYLAGQNLTFRFHFREDEPSEPVEEAPASGARPLRLAPLLVGAAVLILLCNGLALNWTLGERAVVAATEQADFSADPALIHPIIFDEYAAEQTAVSYLNTPFPSDTPGGYRTAEALLRGYGEVLIVSLPSKGDSIIITSDEMIFDQDSLAQVLRSNGFVEFVIYDTAAVRSILGEK